MRLNTLILIGCLLFQLAAFSQTAHIYPPQTEKWNADELGNQRAVVDVDKNDKLVSVTIPWRNNQVSPDQKIILVDSSTQKQFPPSYFNHISKESGRIQFQPISGIGRYYVYYLPYKLGGRSKNYPDAIYLKEQNRVFKTAENASPAKFIRLESVDQFNQMDDMALIATAAEKEQLLKKHQQKPFLLFAETVAHQIQLRDDLPLRWVSQDLEGKTLRAETPKGALFPFQLGIFSNKQDVNNVQVSISPLKDQTGNQLPASSFVCFNTHGISYAGEPISFKVNVSKGKVQALWCGLEIPENIASGTYEGILTVKAEQTPAREIPIQLTITNQVAINKGFDEPWKLNRLSWLNSTLAQENTVIAPYIPIKKTGVNELQILGRKLTLENNGLPAQIQSFFAQDMLSMEKKGQNLLSSAMSFVCKDKAGKVISFKSGNLNFDKQDEGKYSWKSESLSNDLKLNVSGNLEFDGFMELNLELIATQDINLSDIQFHIPVVPQYAKYFMGLGEKGGLRKKSIEWKWDVANKNQDGGWLGAVNGGIQFSLRDEKYARPLNTNFYLQKPLVLPSSWGNENKGGINISEDEYQVLVNNYSGEHQLRKGDTLHFNMHLMVTPFHPINPDWQWSNRFFHAYRPIGEVKNSGANVINLHHGSLVNPYINYPFIATKEMKTYIDSAHQAGLKVKIYNTVREVSDRLYEIHPLRSLGHEVFSPGKGQGYSWLQEHLKDDYIAAWYVLEFKDAAIINSGMNRWHNYYVEGMNWLVDHIGIDGIYLDDVAFDRITMKRIKRVMTKNNHPGIIDLHSANQFNKSDGFNNSANLYLEHFPYLNKLWFGEYFDYENNSPDFFLTEVSGIPFGLMGEMLQDGGNPWRGMIYGMTNRYPWEGARDTRDIWRLWDEFGIQKSKMIGYWVDSAPIRTDNANVLVTSYVNKGKTMIALASWEKADVAVNLICDWKKLGLNPKRLKIYAPEIKNVQEMKIFDIHKPIPVEKGKGWMLIVEQI